MYVRRIAPFGFEFVFHLDGVRSTALARSLARSGVGWPLRSVVRTVTIAISSFHLAILSIVTLRDTSYFVYPSFLPAL